MCTTSAMADQVAKCETNSSLLLENAVSVKEEECQDEDFVDEKINISETAIIIENGELQDNFNCDIMKPYDVSITLDNIKSELSSTNVQHDIKPEDLKIEDGINADNIKIELYNRLLYCEDCQAYREDYCAECDMLVHIMNKNVPVNSDKRLREELPHDNILEVQDDFGQFHVFALKVIPAGVRFGPFTGINTTKRIWKIKGGKFVVNKDNSDNLNWMRYINPARSISEQNLQVYQYEHNLYYESTRPIEQGDELLVHFGEEYKDSLNGNIEMNFIPCTKDIFKDAFACTFCCLGFSSRLYLSKHKRICPGNAAGRFSIEELMQCPSCKIHLDQKEYILNHMAYCCGNNDRKSVPPTPGIRVAHANGRKTRPRQVYKCQQCKYRTKYRGDFRNHVNVHYDVKMYPCGICCRRFKTKDILRMHVENTHICAGDTKDPERSTGVYMNAHMKAEHWCSQKDRKQFQCSLCEFRTMYKTSLQRHMKLKHSIEFRYMCSTCDYKTALKSNLKKHIEASHFSKYKCDMCEYKTKRESGLKMHIKKRHSKEFKYKCDRCDYSTNKTSHLKRHIDSRHLREFKYKCDLCDYKANVKSTLNTHIDVKHIKEFKYKCDECDYKTNVKGNLKSHIEATHLKEFKYKCDICEYKANRKFALNAHIETQHLKEFKYKCARCDYKTNWKSALEKHIEAKHLKEFKYKCGVCEYKASRKSTLNIHVKTKHLSEFKYKCDGCDYKTNWKSSLDTHIEAKHLREFKYKCGTCNYKANLKSALKTHMETKHSK